MTEKIMLVDPEDHCIGYGEKLEVHRMHQLHRAFSVFLVRDGEMLIQKRAAGKYHSAGLWANACCSHQHEGETLEEAVRDRLQFELGIPEGSCNPEELFHFTYYADYGELAEYEIDHVFLASYCGEIWLNPDEAEEAIWISFEALKKNLQDCPAYYAAWFLTAAARVMEILENKDKERNAYE